MRKLRKLPEWIAWRAIPITPWGIQMAFNRRRIERLRDSLHGRRCFVIGNGPSLRIEDLERLRGEITFASNKIHLAFDETDWRPSWYTVIDEVMAANNRQTFRSLALRKIYSWEASRILKPDRHAIVVRSLPHPRDAEGNEHIGFCEDLHRGVHGGYSVLFFSLQAAAFMGIAEVYLIGVDFSFKLSPSTGRSTPYSGEILVSEGEMNHFHPDYRSAGETWTMPRLDKQREAFRVARRWFEKRGGCLLNASRQTELDVLDRVDLDQALEQSSKCE